jgi:hypothetical protein
VQIEELREVVAAWEAREQQRIRIRHAVGEAGLLWAEELRDWLVALGVPTAAIEVRAGEVERVRLELSIGY